MKKVTFLSFCAFMAISLNAQIILDGKNLNIKDIKNISNGEKVEISKDALEVVKKSHDTLLNAAKQGHKIYGLTVGVGLNKDKEMVNAKGELTKEVIEASKKFNIGLIHAHCGGAFEDIDPKIVRAILAIRLNNMLFGGSGVQERVVQMYKEFLNKDIIPAIPSSGSMGEADITILGHIGLAMIGEGDVYYKNQKIPASKALKIEKIEKLAPFGKDSLAILSSNSYSSALASLALDELKHLDNMLKLVYSLSLEALNGNVAPLLASSTNLRPFKDYQKVAKEIREILKDSYLWDKDEQRALQDPLSYRDGAYTISTLDSTINTLEELLKIQLNSSDDNPGISLNPINETKTFQESKVFTKEGQAVIPTSNFEPIIWVLELEKASIALAHNSKATSQRIIKLSDEHFTHLTRFLGTKNTVHAFGAMQKPFVSLDAQNQFLANPVSLNYLPVAGNIEDIATNAVFAGKKLIKQIDNFYYILGMELIHAAQAIDLRKEKNKNLKLSEKTQKLYDDFRKVVKFLDIDRPLTQDFRNSAKFLREYNF